jgi:hypothetical protein
MPRVETIGVAGGGDYAGGSNGVIRSTARVAVSAASMRASGPAFEGGA